MNIKYLLPDNPQKQILDDLLVCFNSRLSFIGLVETKPTRIVTSINNLTIISKVDFISTNACSSCYESKDFEDHMGDRYLLQETKYNFQQNVLNSSINKNKTVCMSVNEETGRKSKFNTNISLFYEGTLYSEPADVANLFVDHFAC